MVAAQSSVFVMVIDCTETGAPPPIVTLATLKARVFRRFASGGAWGLRSWTPDHSGTGGKPCSTLDTLPLSCSQTALPVHPLHDVVVRNEHDEDHEQRATGEMDQPFSFWIDRASTD